MPAKPPFRIDPRSLLQGARIVPARFLQPLPGRVAQDPSRRPSGAPPFAAEAPRLPEMPVAPYDPPALAPQLGPPPNPILGAGDDYEAFATVPTLWPAFQIEQTIYTTKKRWAALDVYLEIPTGAILTNACFTLRVYAIASSGARTLVSSGRYGRLQNNGGASVTFPGPVWICAARAQAERFEVTILFDAPIAAAGTETYRVSGVASDEAVEAPAWVGVIRATATAALANQLFLNIAGISTLMPSPEVVGISAANGAAAARWLHLYDQATNAGIAGGTPQLCFPMGSATGQGFVDNTFRYRPMSGGIILAVSSTLATTTLAADCTLNALFR